MGGYFSTRWGLHRTRPETDPLLALDVRRLKRDGALQPGALATQQWTRGGEPSGTIHTYVDARRPDFLILDYQTRDYGGPWVPVRELIQLITTPCNYGGERVWFACPRCWSRRAVLFSLGGHFRCRACHDLAYSSTREDERDRAMRHVRTLRRQLGGTGGEPAFVAPAKPAGMHWRTYERICDQLLMAEDGTDALHDAAFTRILARIDKRH